MDWLAAQLPQINIAFTKFEDIYEIQKGVLRASGDLYDIFQCRDKNTSELRAVKIYRKLELTEQNFKMIRREIELLKKLDHPNIIKVHSVLEDEVRIYMITDDINVKREITKEKEITQHAMERRS